MLPWYFLNIYLGVFTMTALSAHNYELRPFYFKSAIFDFREASDSVSHPWSFFIAPISHQVSLIHELLLNVSIY